MPYKDKQKQKNAQEKWYQKNKEEHSKKSKERKTKLIEFVRNYKKKDNISCVDCGENRWQCLQFDHGKNEKIDAVSQMARRGFTKEKILKEISKCEIVCANCHCIRHEGFQWKENTKDIALCAKNGKATCFKNK